MKNKNGFGWMFVVQFFFLAFFTLINVYLIQRPVQSTSPAPDSVYSDSIKAAMDKIDSLQVIINAQANRIVVQKQLLAESRKQQSARVDSVTALRMNGQASYFALRTGVDSLPVIAHPDTAYLVPPSALRSANRLFAEGDAAKANEQLLSTLQNSQDSLIHFFSQLKQEYASGTEKLTRENVQLRADQISNKEILKTVRRENKSLWIGGGSAAALLVLSLIF